MVEMILQVRGVSVPTSVPTPPPKQATAPPRAPPARALVPVLRTQAQVRGTGHLLPKPSSAVPVNNGQLPKPTLAKP